MVILENIDIVIDKAILQNIDIDKISNRFKFGISNRARPKRVTPSAKWMKQTSSSALLWSMVTSLAMAYPSRYVNMLAFSLSAVFPGLRFVHWPSFPPLFGAMPWSPVTRLPLAHHHSMNGFSLRRSLSSWRRRGGGGGSRVCVGLSPPGVCCLLVL